MCANEGAIHNNACEISIPAPVHAYMPRTPICSCPPPKHPQPLCIGMSCTSSHGCITPLRRALLSRGGARSGAAPLPSPPRCMHTCRARLYAAALPPSTLSTLMTIPNQHTISGAHVAARACMRVMPTPRAVSLRTPHLLVCGSRRCVHYMPLSVARREGLGLQIAVVCLFHMQLSV
jgi:hypothetical protein